MAIKTESRYKKVINSYIGKFFLLLENKIFLLLSFTFFCLIEALIIKEHVLWRDDARPILISTYNSSIADLYNEVRYESATALYYIILWLINKITPLNIFIVKLLFLLTNISIIYTVLYQLKIPNVYRFLILLQEPTIGYLKYIRPYSFGILLILLFSKAYSQDKDKKLLVYILLFLMCLVSFHTFIAATGLYIFIVFERQNRKVRLINIKDSLFYIGAVLSIVQCIQPADLISGLKTIQPIFSPINSEFIKVFIEDIFLGNIISFLILVLLFLSVFKKNSNKKISLAGISFCILFILISYLTIGVLRYPTSEKHHWILSFTVIGLLCIWNSNSTTINKNYLTFNYFLLFSLLISSINFIQSIPNALIPESKANEVGIYLDRFYPKKMTLNKYDILTDSINLYRKNTHEYYSLNTKRYCKYVKWNHPGVDFPNFRNGLSLNLSSIISDLKETPEDLLSKEPIVIASGLRLIDDLGKEQSNEINKKFKLVYLKEFNGATLENYTLYIVKKT